MHGPPEGKVSDHVNEHALCHDKTHLSMAFASSPFLGVLSWWPRALLEHFMDLGMVVAMLSPDVPRTHVRNGWSMALHRYF